MAQRDERRLRQSSLVAGVGDGVVAVGLPLLAAGITRDPLAVAAVIAAQHLPWVLVGLGWPLLRVDRRTMVGSIDTLRALTLGYIGLQVLAGRETILEVQLAAAVVGLGEALTDGSEHEEGDVGGLSRRGLIGLAVFGFPLGGILYEVFPATPMLFDVLAFALAATFALLVRREIVPPVDGERLRPPRLAPGSTAVTAALALATAGSSAVVGVLVLFALDDLGLGAPAFGLLLAGLAAATAAGAWVAPEAGRIVGLRPGACLAWLVAGAGPVVASRVADVDRPWLAATALAAGAAAVMVGSVLARAQLQRATGFRLDSPPLRRFHLVVWAAIPLGALLGGWFARRQGVADTLQASAALSLLATFVLALGGRTPVIPANHREIGLTAPEGA